MTSRCVYIASEKPWSFPSATAAPVPAEPNRQRQTDSRNTLWSMLWVCSLTQPRQPPPFTVARSAKKHTTKFVLDVEAGRSRDKYSHKSAYESRKLSWVGETPQNWDHPPERRAFSLTPAQSRDARGSLKSCKEASADLQAPKEKMVLEGSMLPLAPNEHKHWDHQTKQSVALCKDNHTLLALPHSSKENNMLKPPGTRLLMM